MTETLSLPDATFRDLRDYIYERSGIYVQDTKKYLLETRLARRLQANNLPTYEEYLRFVRVSGNGELQSLFDAVTTNETYFFREPQHFDALVNHILPEVLGKKKTRDVRIWSAACSTGEEPYTIAAVLREKAPDVRPEIVGSDISEAVLSSARRGIYTSYSVRITSPSYERKCFRAEDGHYVLHEDLRKSVKFMNINLTNEREVRALRNVDVIFCRNVLIYFDDKAKRKAVSLMYDALAPHGYLLVGAAESLHNVTRALMPTVVDRVVLYRKAAE